MKRFLIALAFFLMLTGSMPLHAAEGLPPGKWWDRPEIVQTLGLSSEQRVQLDKIFRASAPELIDFRGDVQKRSLELRGQLDQQQLNRQAIQTAAIRLSEARSKLFERELMMFVDMRGVLSADQWNRFRDQLAAHEVPRGRRRGDGPGQRRPQE